MSSLASKVSDITNQLDRLLPLGTLNFYKLPAIPFQGVDSPDGWKWFESPDVFSPIQFEGLQYGIHPLVMDMNYLITRGFIKVTYSLFSIQIHGIYELCARIRLYLVPSDIDGSRWLNLWRERLQYRKSVNWNNKRFLMIMEKLMCMLDYSDSNWKLQYNISDSLRVPDGTLYLPFLVSYEEYKTNNIGISDYGVITTEKSLKYHLIRLEKRQLYTNLPSQFVTNTTTKLTEIYEDIISPHLSSDKFDPEDEKESLILDVLRNNISGLKSTLYKYQIQSVAKMLDRELFPKRVLAPNLVKIAPIGDNSNRDYYLDILNYNCFLSPEYYLLPRGGILAENMGLGKTCICLALICASKYQISEIPPEAADLEVKDQEVQKLSEYCVREIQKSSTPWKCYTENIPPSIVKLLERSHGYFFIEEMEDINIRRSFRLGANSPRASKKLYLSNCTLVICPDNLFHQWVHEIQKHVLHEYIKVLEINNSFFNLPGAFELLKYDVILMSIGSFARQSESSNSPLREVYWKRLIIDEGHSMNSKSTRAAYLAKELDVERRWAVSGTPTTGLTRFFVNEIEDDISTADNSTCDNSEYVVQNTFDEKDDLAKLGTVVTNFLKLEPFYSSPKLWTMNILKPFLKNSYGSDTQLQNLLSSVIVRHSLNEVENEVDLPPLHHKAVFLQPSYHNRLAINLFTAVLAANAVSSERTDIDYMFHPSNRAQLRTLVSNLQRATFYWSGFSQQDVETLVDICEKSLTKTKISGDLYYDERDLDLLRKSIIAAKAALSNARWRTVAFLHEMTFYISGLPKCYTRSLGIGKVNNEIAVFGAPHISAAQKFFYKNRFSDDNLILYGRLDVYSKPFWENYWKESEKRNKERYKHQDGQTIEADTVKSSMETPKIARESSISVPPSPERTKLKPSNNVKKEVLRPELLSRGDGGLKETDIPLDGFDDMKSSKNAKLLGTGSAKLSYLGARLLEHDYDGIKSLVFFEFEDNAYYLTELLDVLGVNYIMYATFVKPEKRAKNLEEFTESELAVTLIMDLKLASHGLTVIAATRVYFINPVWKRSVEAQAIKRAHRIGQTKEVYVETLILEDTIEEEMYKRREKGGEDSEQNDGANKTVIDDTGMQDYVLKHLFLDHDPDEAEYVSLFAHAVSSTAVFGSEMESDTYSLKNHTGFLDKQTSNRMWEAQLFSSMNLDKLNEQTAGKWADDPSFHKHDQQLIESSKHFKHERKRVKFA